jgi:hypothetical protein
MAKETPFSLKTQKEWEKPIQNQWNAYLCSFNFYCPFFCQGNIANN